jgi:hypothetical protein
MIEPIPYFYESINRNAIVVKPKKPLFDWINFIYPESPVSEKEEGIFISFGNGQQRSIEKWLKRNLTRFFKTN